MTPLLTKLAEIEQRAEKATPGPWLAWQLGEIGCREQDQRIQIERQIICSLARDCRVFSPDLNLTQFVNDDLEFIAASRTDIPTLTKALRRAVESLESVGSVHANRPRHAEEKYWTDLGCPQRFAETLATDTRMARAALADIQKIMGGDG